MMAATSPPRLLLLSRPGCGLCAELAEDLETAFGADACVLEQVDVDSREDWRQRWGLLIPVLLDDDGKPLSVTRLNLSTVAAALGRSPRRSY